MTDTQSASVGVTTHHNSSYFRKSIRTISRTIHNITHKFHHPSKVQGYEVEKKPVVLTPPLFGNSTFTHTRPIEAWGEESISTSPSVLTSLESSSSLASIPSSYSILSSSDLSTREQTEQSTVFNRGLAIERYIDSNQMSSQKTYIDRADGYFTKAQDQTFTEDDRQSAFSKAIEAAEYAAALGCARGAHLLLKFYRDGVRQFPGSNEFLITPADSRIEKFWSSVTKDLEKTPNLNKALGYEKESITASTTPIKKMEVLIEISRAVHAPTAHYPIDYIKEWSEAFQTIKKDNEELPVEERPTIPEFVWQRRASLKATKTYL
jgi:hypothetical protein